MHLIVDAHLDLAWNALSWNRDLTQPLAASRKAESAMTDHPARGRGTVAFPEMRGGGIALCLGTLLARANPSVHPTDGQRRRNLDFINQDVAWVGTYQGMAITLSKPYNHHDWPVGIAAGWPFMEMAWMSKH